MRMKHFLLIILAFSGVIITNGATKRTAAEKVDFDQFPELVETAVDNYDIVKAKSIIDDWRAALKKAKKAEPAEIAELESRITMISNQLDRVENISITARYDLSKNEFFKALENHNPQSPGTTDKFPAGAGSSL